jgi:hypothetical protein
MAEFQWWLLIVGLVAGGAFVAALSMDASRRAADLEPDERAAEATFIAEQLASDGRILDRETVAAVLAAQETYLKLPPPDRLEPTWDSGDRHADRQPHEVGDGRGGRPDEDLPPA